MLSFESFNIIKRHGALSAKGRTIGIQFDVLFTDNLYFDISRHAITMAMRLRETLRKKGYRFFLDSPSNQQFVVLPNDKVKALSENVEFTIWQPYDEDSQVCRFVTSWATTEEQLAALEAYL